jgi:hypothetical protein
MTDEFALLFEIDASRRAELYDDKGRPILLAKLKRADRKRYEELMVLYKERRIADLRALKQEVDAVIRAAEKAAEAKAKAAKNRAGDFRTTKQGDIIATDPDNIALAISKLGVTLRYDDFRGWPIVEGLDGFGPALDDAAMNRLWLTVQRQFDLRPALGFFQIVIADTCRLNTFHPVRDYLDGLEWDGKPRLDHWLIRYCKADDTQFNQAVSRISLIAAVRRVRQPGTKFDNLIVLEGREGIAKSILLSILARRDEWFTDSVPLSVDDKRMIESTSGKWIAEFGELSGMRKGEVEKIKAQLSRQTDRARLAYGKLPVEVKRQFVGFGTTNNSQYLASLTGNRRFWPVAVKQIDLKAFNLNVDQLWAEASVREALGESIILDEKLWPAAAKEQAKREIVNPFFEPLAEAIGDQECYIFVTDIWKILGIDAGRQTQHDYERVGKAMKALGFEKTKRRLGGARLTAYQRGQGDKRLTPSRVKGREWTWYAQTDANGLEEI